MAKSIRVTDDLYRLAAAQAALCERSIAQQVEYWAKLGLAVEKSPLAVSVVEVAIAKRDAADALDYREGRISMQDLCFIPADAIRRARLTIPHWE